MDKFNKINSLVSNSNYYINYSERVDKSSFSDEKIWEYLHRRISGSSCTILLLTEDLFTYNKRKIDYIHKNFIESGWIYNDISASLRDWKDNRINGLVCVIDDNLFNKIKDINNDFDPTCECGIIIKKPNGIIMKNTTNNNITLNQLANMVNNLTGTVNNLSTNLNNLSVTVNNLTVMVVDGFKNVNDRIDKIEHRLDKLKNEFYDFKKEMYDFKNKQEVFNQDVKNELKEINKRLDVHEKVLKKGGLL